MLQLGESQGAWCPEGDLRHYFYRIRLADDLRGVFSILGPDGHALQARVLLRGFSWAPILAQQLTATLAVASLSNSEKWLVTGR